MQKDLQATLVSQKCWKPQAPNTLQWSSYSNTRVLRRAWKEDWQNSPPSNVLSEGPACKTKFWPLWELSGSRPFEMFCPHVLPCVTHWLHPQQSQGPEQNVCKFSSACLPISFISLLPLKATLPFGTRIKRIKETGQEKEQCFLFPDNGGVAPKQGWLHFATTTWLTSLALTWHTWAPGTCQWKPVALGSSLQLLS